MASYTFGSFQFNNNSGGFGYFFLSKNFDLPKVKASEFPIARRDGTKKSGEYVESRQIGIGLKVVGTSYTDLLTRLDTLKQNLALRSQNLTIHPDGRYYQSVDCIDAVAKIDPINVVQCTVQCTFKAYDPYAYAVALSSYDTGIVALTLASSLWNFPSISVTGGGTYYSYPLIHVINKTSTGSTTLSAGLTNGSTYTTLSINTSPFSALTGDQIIITHSAVTQTLTLSSPVAVGATTINVNSFTASAGYVSGDTVSKVSQWTSISIVQSQDSEILTASTSSSVPLPSLYGDYIDIMCDPATSQGWSVQTNGTGLDSDPQGIFPVIEPGVTTFNIAIASASAVSAECVISWKGRYV